MRMRFSTLHAFFGELQLLRRLTELFAHGLCRVPGVVALSHSLDADDVTVDVPRTQRGDVLAWLDQPIAAAITAVASLDPSADH